MKFLSIDILNGINAQIIILRINYKS